MDRKRAGTDCLKVAIKLIQEALEKAQGAEYMVALSDKAFANYELVNVARTIKTQSKLLEQTIKVLESKLTQVTL